MRVSSLVFFMLALIIALTVAQFNPLRHVKRQVESTKDTEDFVISFCRCKGSTTWTMHGLWPENGFYCTQEKFDMNQVDSIHKELSVDWISCPEFSHTEEYFWSHEFEKHGTCTKINGKSVSQLQYFSVGLSLLHKYRDLCSPTLTGECRFTLDKNLNIKNMTHIAFPEPPHIKL